MGLGFKLSAILFVLMLAMGGLGSWYYSDTQERLAILQENNSILQTSLDQTTKAKEKLERDIVNANQQIAQVNKEFAEIRSQNTLLANKLEKHNLGVLASRKPGLVERVINNATDKASRCFELLSGAELTEQEKNAENGKAFNSECPWIFDGTPSPDTKPKS